MIRKSVSIVAATMVVAGLAVQPAAAQVRYPQAPYQAGAASNPYEDGYRAGYQAGYQAGRQRVRYNDQLGPTAYGGLSPQERWRQRYAQTYSYNDDRYYQECRDRPDPGGVIAGALIGGILGNVAGGHGSRGATTMAGVIIGGVLGASLTSRLDCGDRSYAYKTYYDAFNSGRPHSNWQWDNPDNGHYGDFRVNDYYYDSGGFRCATYTQQVYIDGVPQVASGQACQQPDGTWAIVS